MRTRQNWIRELNEKEADEVLEHLFDDKAFHEAMRECLVEGCCSRDIGFEVQLHAERFLDSQARARGEKNECEYERPYLVAGTV